MLEQYTIEKAIGRGHFSVVHRAVRLADGKRVALKKIQIFDMLDTKARERCLREVNLLQSLPPHTCIIQYLDSFIDNNELYIVFEWAEHGDLKRLLRRALESNASLQEHQIWRYFTQVVDGVRHMHEARVMHRDIKPANIFLAANGCVKLGDLGLGRAFSSQTYEALSKVGTPLYMSPEVLDGRGYEWKSDVWSLGCLLYELATLRSPFKSQGDKDDLYTLFRKISAGQFAELPAYYSSQLSQLVRAMIQTDPTSRPDINQTFETASKALAAFEAAAAQSAANAPSDADTSSSRSSGDCFIVMEAVLDKLKLLQYEAGLLRPRELPPLPRGYFASSALWPAPAQFHYLFNLICWLLHITVAPQHDLWKLLPARAADTDHLAAASALLEQLGKGGNPLNEHSQMAPHRLVSASGIEVCKLLNTLTNVALTASGFAWEQPKHPVEPQAEDELQEVEEEAELKHDDGCGSGSDEAGSGSDDDGSTRQPARLLPIMKPTIPPSLWADELHRCASHLTLQVPWQQLRWSHRLAMVQQHARGFATAVPELEPGLERVSAQAEAMRAEVAPLREEQARLAQEAEKSGERVSSAHQRVAELEVTLRSLDEEVAVARERTTARGAVLSDGSAVVNMQAAVRSVRKETHQLEMRAAMAQQQLRWQRLGQKSNDASGSGFGSDSSESESADDVPEEGGGDGSVT